MTLVGFKRMTIGVFDKETGKLGKQIVVEGKQDEGATVSAEISGLAKEATKVYGSNIAYYVSQKGTGDVSIDFGLLDLPENANDTILGYEVKNGISFVGENTEPPYCVVLLESEDLSGDTAMMAFFKGKFSQDGSTLNTTNNEAFEPEAETYTFTAVTSDADGDSNGQVMGKYVGKEEKTIAALKALAFPTAGE
ncbi:major tail protein [Vagococcus entomophilus]|uniref:Phage tail protein n=1 Tax=Vagococcus entomophilus TaxID=1160095 RepID=A0A430AJY2_9ENTE|nr:major tail protein [Vagococcus entomophilus]RSU08432.1 phage tail protein [Vagococcus entomophilus]